MTQESLLTAIVFTYNHKCSIAKCIESVLNQNTEYKYEIHIWDDCSIDGTSDICRGYAQKYPNKIKLVVQKENTFTKPDLELQSYAAISSVKTKYFCIIDGDDYWCNESKLQTGLYVLENNPEYVGFAHDALQINQNSGEEESYIHSALKMNEIKNPVTFSAEAPFFLTSSRIFRKLDYEKLGILPIDYLLYYYHLSKGPIYYHDEIMAAYVIGESSTFANLGEEVRILNSMFAYRLSLLFNFEQDDFCTAMQQRYDKQNFQKSHRYQRLLLFKKIFGIKLGWKLWFILTFVPKFSFNCMSINYVYSRKKAKKIADSREHKHEILMVEYTKRLKHEKKCKTAMEKLLKFKLPQVVQSSFERSLQRKAKRIDNLERMTQEILASRGGNCPGRF